MSSNGSHNLYQRLNAMSAEVARIKPTGKTAPSQGAQPAMSIADVEDALRDLFVKHGVVSGYSFTNQPVIVDTRKTQSGNDQFTWQADLNVWLVNADKPEERIDCRAVDIGSSPSAAVSFCLKRFFRALFHLAEEGDEGDRASQPRVRQANVRGAREEARSQPTGAGSVPEGSRATGGRTERAAVGLGSPNQSAASTAVDASGTAASSASERTETKAQATLRLMRALEGSSVSKESLNGPDGLSARMGGPERWSDAPVAIISAIADEIEALKQSVPA